LLYEVHIWELVRDEDGSIKTWQLVDANSAALKSWKKTLPEIVGKKTDEIFPGANATELFMPIVRKIFEEDKPHHWESYFSGTGQILHMTSIPLGELFVSTGIDINLIKRAEKEFNSTVLRLTEAINAGNVGLWDWDLITNDVYYSREWKKQIGYNDDEIGNMFEEWEKRVHPDDLEKTLKVVNNSLYHGSKHHDVEFRFKHKDGSYRWILAHASVIRDEQGKPIRMLGSHIDITERKQMEHTLNQSQKMKALGILASGIAHDFNNLLAPIIGYTELVKMRLAPQSQEFEYLQSVMDSAIRAKDLVQKILVTNRASLAKMEAVQLKTLIDEVLTVIQASIPKNIEIRQESDFDIPLISADSSQLYQVILNLCTNSVQAMKDGGELLIRLNRIKHGPEILEQTQTSNEYLCLSVQDNGCGIDSDTLKHIYDPFFTTKEKGEQRGVGLGLAIVFSVVEKHKGYIEVESEVGTGTIFRVYFPVLLQEETFSAKETESSVDSGNEHILLIDDEKMVCDLGTAMLQELGYQVTAYTDCEEALRKFEVDAQDFQLVITDYSMPKMTGPQLMQKIKDIRPDTPILLLTGYSNLATSENLQKWGCNGIVAKPYNSKELSQAVRQILTK
jgi:PAS domain S-box-containing protein